MDDLMCPNLKSPRESSVGRGQWRREGGGVVKGEGIGEIDIW